MLYREPISRVRAATADEMGGLHAAPFRHGKWRILIKGVFYLLGRPTALYGHCPIHPRSHTFTCWWRQPSTRGNVGYSKYLWLPTLFTTHKKETDTAKTNMTGTTQTPNLSSNTQKNRWTQLHVNHVGSITIAPNLVCNSEKKQLIPPKHI